MSSRAKVAADAPVVAVPGQVVVAESEPAPDDGPQTDRARTRAEKEAQELADQTARDLQRGYREIEWKPGVAMFQSVDTGHTSLDENDMRTYVADHRGSSGTVAPPKGSPFA